MTGPSECIAEDYSAETCPCPECAKWRDNREPGADGDAFRGDERAGYEREQQAEAQRLK